jgi:hypothetical protein
LLPFTDLLWLLFAGLLVPFVGLPLPFTGLPLPFVLAPLLEPFAECVLFPFVLDAAVEPQRELLALR